MFYRTQQLFKPNIYSRKSHDSLVNNFSCVMTVTAPTVISFH